MKTDPNVQKWDVQVLTVSYTTGCSRTGTVVGTFVTGLLNKYQITIVWYLVLLDQSK